ncbi:uncharacterized protein EDB91DRAFT_1254203 [Suillus paluster]|uniref:uncharacterized protein n=1 Tax=Suillus paluster TaxID=48578 RepID=UPI001B865F3C|nr:uncharacterized protein EDB91DRAFT_1254203 [Suillus paluster]KAG1726702.1 hypothetical protein EDB91DRAFT_1254203 [Suillus paluster]
MPAAQWTTKEQYKWLHEQLPEYIALHGEDKDYAHFWAKTHLYWFKSWPEQAALFPDIPIEIPLTEEQQAEELAAEKTRKVRLQTWFRWRTNVSKKNRGLKKEISVFESALLPKSRAKSVEEIYMDMVYDERIKPLVAAEQEAGNVATAGRRMALGRKFCKELLEDESDEVKKEVREKYNKQKKVKKDMLHDKADDDDNNDETDADAIVKGIDDLPIICQRFARLIKKKTRFIVSFMCAGPDPRQNWNIVTLSCHPSETPAGNDFSQLCPDKDNTFLAAYQEYAELIFPPNKRNPLLPDVEDGDQTEELEGCNSGKESEDGEENNEGQRGDSIDWDNLGFASSSTGISDASPLGELNQSALYSETQAQCDASFVQAQPDAPFKQAQPDASFKQAQPDASLEHAWDNIATVPPNSFSTLQSSVPGTVEVLGLSFSHADLMALGYFGSDNTTQNLFSPAFSSSAPSFDTQYDTHTWNGANSDSQGWEMRSLSSFLSSPISAKRSTATTEQDDALPQFTQQLPILPAANPPSPTEQDDTLPQFTQQLPILPAANPPSPTEGIQDLADTHAGAGLAKSKRKFKSKPATKVKHNPAMESTPIIAPMNTAKPKPKPKARPVAKLTETSHTAVDEGNPVAQRASKQIPIKSKWNDIADAIGSDGLTFVSIGKETQSVSEDARAMKRPANSTMEGVISAKKKRTKV